MADIKQAIVTSPCPELFGTNEVQYDRKNVLGKGNSVVFSGTFGDRRVAVRRTEISEFVTDVEVRNHQKLSHENIVGFLSVQQDINFR